MIVTDSIVTRISDSKCQVNAAQRECAPHRRAIGIEGGQHARLVRRCVPLQSATVFQLGGTERSFPSFPLTRHAAAPPPSPIYLVYSPPLSPGRHARTQTHSRHARARANTHTPDTRAHTQTHTHYTHTHTHITHVRTQTHTGPKTIYPGRKTIPINNIQDPSKTPPIPRLTPEILEFPSQHRQLSSVHLTVRPPLEPLPPSSAMSLSLSHLSSHGERSPSTWAPPALPSPAATRPLATRKLPSLQPSPAATRPLATRKLPSLQPSPAATRPLATRKLPGKPSDRSCTHAGNAAGEIRPLCGGRDEATEETLRSAKD